MQTVKHPRVPGRDEYRVIVLDFDGVVVESNDIKHRAMAEIFRPYTEKYEEIMAYHRGHNAVNRFVKFRHIQENILAQPYDEKLTGRWAAEFAALTRRQIISCPFVTGAEEFLKYYSRAYPLYLASATPHEELGIILAARGLTGYFKEFFGAPKPKTATFAEIAAREKIEPAELLFIGDSAEDQRSAAAFGCRFVARQSDHNFVESGAPVFADLQEIYNALQLS